MTRKAQARSRVATALAHNPLEGEQLLLEAMFGDRPAESMLEPVAPAAAPVQPMVKPAPTLLRPPKPVKRSAPENKPQHYKIVSISLYIEDIDRLEQMVQELKARGHHKANKSQLIRHALTQVDLDRVPKEL